MLRWALGFFIIALVAALLGFGGIAVAAAGIARVLFFIFLILFWLLCWAALSDGPDWKFDGTDPHSRRILSLKKEEQINA